MNRYMSALAILIIKINKRFSRFLGSGQLHSIHNKGERCRFEGVGQLIDPERITLGEHVSIGKNFFIRASGGLTIGSYTHISRNVTIHTVNHNTNGDKLPYDRKDILKPIEIGSYVWVGMNVNILPGVKIGDGAIIGMGATIAKDIRPGEVVVGAQQRVVGQRDEAKTNKLSSEREFLKI